MRRKIIKINEELCNGCGACVAACHEAAIGMIDGKAKLLRDDYCDGLGDCLPVCPVGAITFEEREALAYDKKAVEKNNWPVQIKLAPVTGSMYQGARLLIAADCTAYAYADFHEEFMKDRITLIGCPKLDAVDYADKLAEILKNNEIRSVTLIRMEVPCCKGMEYALEKAVRASGKVLPWNVVVLSTEGRILER